MTDHAPTLDALERIVLHTLRDRGVDLVLGGDAPGRYLTIAYPAATLAVWAGLSETHTAAALERLTQAGLVDMRATQGGRGPDVFELTPAGVKLSAPTADHTADTPTILRKTTSASTGSARSPLAGLLATFEAPSPPST